MVMDALHHFPNQEKVIEELFRVVKPGGIILIEEPDINRLLVKLIAIAEKLALMGSHIHSPTEINKMMRKFSSNINIIPNERISAWIIGRK
jgi:demethylmenaquinone methyltransferase/2-methoxy-6-polyprenyl-1,4-benzoquinol methylase